MDRYVPLNKRTKRKQREANSAKRAGWGNINPVTRSVPSGKVYNRNKLKHQQYKLMF